MGPILYLLYNSPLSDNVDRDRDLAVSNIERCVLEIDHWMLVNRLELNKDKTELLVISAKHLPIPIAQEISVVSETIRSSQKARNIGVTFDIFFSTIMLEAFANHLFIIFVISAI